MKKLLFILFIVYSISVFSQTIQFDNINFATATSNAQFLGVVNISKPTTTSFIWATGGVHSSTGINNIVFGANAGASLGTATKNVFIGTDAGGTVTDDACTFIGYKSGETATTGSGNTGVGAWTLTKVSGANNVAIGDASGFLTTTGTWNTFVGADAGGQNVIGSRNVFIGAEAGENELTSNKLYIENSNIPTPLIYGDFSINLLRINGTLQVNDPSITGFAFPTTDGTANQILETDGTGALSWITPSSGGSFGLVDQIPVTNSTTDDFDYTSNFTFDGSNLKVSNSYLIGSVNAINFPTTNSITIGLNAVLATMTGTANTFTGHSAGNATTTGSSNTYYGFSSGNLTTTQSDNTFLGGGVNSTSNACVYIGRNSGLNSTGTNNVCVGVSTFSGGLSSNTVAIGTRAMSATSTGDFNIAIGNNAMSGNTSGSLNVVIGGNANEGNTTGSNNVFIGVLSANNNKTGSNNVCIGNTSSQALRNFTGCVFLGNQAGNAETGNNKLYIDNSATATPLIGGDFSANTVTITGGLTVSTTTNAFTPPVMTAIQGSALTPTDGMLIYVTSTNGTFTSIGFWGRVSGAWTQL